MDELKLAIAQDVEEHAKEKARLTWEKKHGFGSALTEARKRLEEVKLEIERMIVWLKEKIVWLKEKFV